MDSSQLRQNIKNVVSIVEATSNRKQTPAKLIAVTKNRDVGLIRSVCEIGILDLGENRPSELQNKVEHFSGSEFDLTWHFIGDIQSKYCKTIATHADYVHSVDRLKEVRLLNKYRIGLDPLSIFIQVNVSGESAKGGLLANNWMNDIRQYQAVLCMIEESNELANIECIGLMTMTPLNASGDERREIFSSMNQLRKKLIEDLGYAVQLSMGMSSDFEIAVQEGANYIRVGSKLFA